MWSDGGMNTFTADDPRTDAAPVLTAADRCDQCGARAWVRVTMTAGDLHFCAHHASKHMDALNAQALEILDERQYMTVA